MSFFRRAALNVGLKVSDNKSLNDNNQIERRRKFPMTFLRISSPLLTVLASYQGFRKQAISPSHIEAILHPINESRSRSTSPPTTSHNNNTNILFECLRNTGHSLFELQKFPSECFWSLGTDDEVLKVALAGGVDRTIGKVNDDEKWNDNNKRATMRVLLAGSENLSGMETEFAWSSNMRYELLFSKQLLIWSRHSSLVLCVRPFALEPESCSFIWGTIYFLAESIDARNQNLLDLVGAEIWAL